MDEPSPTKLENSLIEMCVVVGMDQDTGLLPVSAKEKVVLGSNSKSLPIFKSFYKPHVLAALSGETAVFTYTASEVDGKPFYKPGSVTSSTPVKGKKTLRRRVSATPGLSSAMLPVSAGVLTSLPPLCLPDGGQVFDSPRGSVIHYLVLTDIEGTRTYCCCLKIYKPYLAKENDDIPGQYNLVYSDSEYDEEGTVGSSYTICYAPLCCCIISKYPYFSIFKDCLSSMISNLFDEPRKFRSGLMQFVSQLAMVPIPPPGSLAIEFHLSGVNHTVNPVDEPDKRIVDIELHYPFLCFSIDDVLLLMSCVLTQQRLIFISSKYAMLTLVIESIFSFIQPLSWSWTYVPVLPNNLVDMTEAPGVYIIGCHTSLKPQIERAMSMHEMADLIIVNIDDGKITMGESVEVHTIPSRVADPFKARMKSNGSPLFDLHIINRPSFLTAYDMKKERHNFMTKFNNAVLTASLEMMAKMLSDAIPETSNLQGENFFDLAEFIASKADEDQEFYKALCATHAFSKFLEDRLRNPEKRDYFTTIMEKVSPQQNRPQLRKRSSSSTVNPSKCASFDDESKESLPLATFTLPSFTFEGLFKGSFYESCLAELTTAIENLDSKSSHLVGNYLYLRGMLKVARGKRIDGLDDLFALSTRNMQLYRYSDSYIGQLLTQLTPEEQSELHTKSFFGKASMITNRKKETDFNRNRVRVTTSAVPSNPLDQTEFVKRVTMLQITDSCQTAGRLFEVLMNKMNRLVDPAVFSNFYRSLQETDRTAQSIKLTGITAEAGESVVLASSWLRTATGNGRLIATTNRLIFMNEGTHKCETVMRYEDIQHVENYQYYVVIPPGVASLKITSRCKATSPFIVCLKEDRSFWNDCIREMVAGYRIGQETKDHQTIKQASQNIIIADALRGSDHLDSIRNILYLKDIQNAVIEKRKLSKETKKMLERRIDPTPQASETGKNTVEAMVFAPESKENKAEVWCGLGSGAVVVIDTVSWDIVTVLRYPRDRVSCLESVGKNHIWVGSMDTTIYIINRKTKQADQQLHSHGNDYISHIIKTENQDGSLTVWSASLKGLIIGWDPVTLTPKKTIKLDNVNTMTSVVAIGNSFWCVTQNAVLVVDRDSSDGSHKILTCKANKDNTRSINCMCIITDDTQSQAQQVWTACDKKGIIASWDTTSFTYKEHQIPCKGFTQMLFIDGKVWGGGRDNIIYIIDSQTVTIEKTLQLHTDKIRSMCVTDTSYILTGPGSSDGRIAVWRSHLLDIRDTDCDEGFEFM